MLPLTETLIRASFINATRSERGNVLLPADLDRIPWDRLDFLGWRDRKLTRVGYVVTELDGALVGLIMRESDTRARSRPQCVWCNDVELPNDVVMFSTKRAGDAGRRGDTVGTLVCANFECSRNVRRLPPLAYVGFDRDAARDRRIETLRENVRGFARAIRDGV
ncbi:FBP domain-containing protein [Microbacterium sp. 18062]|uniref:FBP domain-containing protein n=1 Tax=Microbacterium sp. 18062 TaxID=2681410 RepID=UPI00135ABAA2|nr:FBP domain-containing protein [Microbacterium sp. 18062]